MPTIVRCIEDTYKPLPVHPMGLFAAAARAVAFRRWCELMGYEELIDLKCYTQMADYRDFRFPYRFEKLYFDEV